jgi:hypothetical protein
MNGGLLFSADQVQRTLPAGQDNGSFDSDNGVFHDRGAALRSVLSV